MRSVLTVAGSDPSGGAGIQADLKTMLANGVYSMSVITALTAQNTMGVFEILRVRDSFFRAQLESVLSDIMPDAVKVGMTYQSSIIQILAEALVRYRAKHIVVDPVMVSTSGKSLLSGSARAALMDRLLPIAELVTPNVAEAEILSGMRISSPDRMERAAERITEKFGCSALIKGGHLQGEPDDLLFHEGKRLWIRGKRLENPNTHGTGCTLSSAIAANLAKGFSLADSVRRAKEFVTGAIASNLNLGRGRGPLNHSFDLNSRFLQAADENKQS